MTNANPVRGLFLDFMCAVSLFPPVFICLFVWQEVIKRYLIISRNRTVKQARQKSYKEKVLT